MGEEIPMAPVIVPTGIPCPDLTIGANDVTPPHTSTGGPLGNGTYCYHNVNMEGGSQFVVSGPVNIYITGTMQAVGGTVVGKPDDPTATIFYIASGGIATIEGTVAGESQFYGAIYAPDATIAIGGDAKIFGAVLAEDIYVAGNAQIHYDEAFSDLDRGPQDAKPVLQSWREL